MIQKWIPIINHDDIKELDIKKINSNAEIDQINKETQPDLEIEISNDFVIRFRLSKSENWKRYYYTADKIPLIEKTLKNG